MALEAIGVLESAVSDRAHGFQNLMPRLNAPSQAIPFDLLGRGCNTVDLQVGEQHPADRLDSWRRMGLGGRDNVQTDRLRGAGGLGIAASLRWLDRHPHPT